MPIAATYDPATELLDPTGGTEGTPHDLVNMCQLDEDGSVELLAAVGPAAGLTLDYQIRPGHQGAQILEVVLDSTNAAGGDTVDFSGRDTFGASLSESVDVSAGNGTYFTTARFSEMHHVDCTGFSDAVGTIVINQNQWGVVLPRLGPELCINGSFWDGAGWTIDAVWTISGGVANGNGASGSAEKLKQNTVVSGNIYRTEYTVSGIAGGEGITIRLEAAAGIERSINGTFVEYLQSTGDTLTFRGHITNGFSGTIDNVSVRKLTGAFSIRANMDVGNGSTSTYFRSLNEVVRFEDGFVYAVKSAATCQRGELSGDYGINGSVWSVGPSGIMDIVAVGGSGVDLYYASRLHIRTSQPLRWRGGISAFNKFVGSSIGTSGGSFVWITGGTPSFQDVDFLNIKDFELGRTPSVMANVHTHVARYGILARGNIIATNLRWSGTIFTDIRQANPDTLLLVNPEASITSVTNTSAASIIIPQLTTNIHISDRGGLPIETAGVVCKSFGNITSFDGGSTFWKCIADHTSDSDTDFTSTDGIERVTDGDFPNGDNWTIEGVWTIEGGAAHGNGAAGGSEELLQDTAAVIPATYRLEYTVSGIQPGETLAVIFTAASAPTVSTDGTYVVFIKTVVGATTLKFRGHDTNGFSGTVSNISVQLVDELDPALWELTTDDLADAAGVTGVSAQTGAWTTAVDYVKAAELFSVSTDADGDIAQQTIDYQMWKGTSVPLQSLAPFTITVSKAIYTTLIMNDVAPTIISNVVQPLVLSFKLYSVLSEDDVTNGTDFFEDQTGNRVEPVEANVRNKILYGANGTEKEGTLGSAPVAAHGMIRAYLNENVVRHPYSATDEWGSVTYGSNVDVRARVNHRNIVITNVQGEGKVSRIQILLAPNQTVNAQDEWTVDGERLAVIETKKSQDFVMQLKEVRLV